MHRRATHRRHGNAPQPLQARAARVAVLVVILAWVLTWFGRQPPTPLPADAPETVFSATRAWAVLARILGDQRPHPIGSDENHAVRRRIVAEFEALGVTVQERPRFVCTGFGRCGTAHNLLVHLPGRNPALPAVLLAAHYDSVGAGPGAGDAGHAVAAGIELTRALRARAPLARDVYLLIGDGEEFALLGAEAFAQEPEYARIGRVINLEARGTGGTSELFETHVGNAEAIAALAAALPYPTGSSTSYEVYLRLPNNTDFSVFKRDGLAGANFAFIGAAQRYHTPLDNLDWLDPRALQQQGANALAAITAFAEHDGEWRRESNRVFFDVFGWRLLGWPQGLNWPLLLMAVSLWPVTLLRQPPARRGVESAGYLVATLLPLLAGAAAFGLAQLWRMADATPAQWTANATSLQWAVAALALLINLTTARVLVRRMGHAGWLRAATVPMLLAAAATALFSPGASYLGLVPALAAYVLLVLAPAWPLLAACAAGTAAAITLGPLVLSFYTALGTPVLGPLGALVSLATLPVAAAIAASSGASRWPRLLFATATVALAAIAAWQPPFDAGTRPHLSMQRIQGEEHAWLRLSFSGDALPSALTKALPQPPRRERVLPWDETPQWAVALDPDPTQPVPRVEAERIHDGSEARLVLRLSSPRGADQIGLLLPRAVAAESPRIDGIGFSAPVRGAARADGAWRPLLIQVAPGQVVTVSFAWPEAQPAEGYLYDFSYGLPGPLATIQAARDRAAVPVHNGDIEIHWSRWQVPAADAASADAQTGSE